MKLNKKGWGLNTLLIIGSCLLIFLLIAAYYIYALYSSLGISNGNIYKELEARLELAAENYDSKENISLEKLRELGYIKELKDNNNDDCNGYVIYNKKEYKAYIDCKYYTTKGYDIKKLYKK